MSDQWLSIVEYARTFAVSDMTIRRRIKTGKIEAVLRDGKYYIQVGRDESGRPLRLDVRNDQPVTEHQTDFDTAFDPVAQALTAQTLSGASLPRPLPSQNAGRADAPERGIAPIMKQRSNPSSLATSMYDLASNTPPNYPNTNQAIVSGNYESGLIPGHIRLGIGESATSLVDSKALLDFCESVLRRFSRLEARLEEGFKSKVALLENQMNQKDQESNKLRQQIEDLQLLIKILEKGSPGSRY